MSALVKAELQVLDKNDRATDTIPVQFNPTTMQLQMTNSVDGGTSRGRQTQQYNGSASTQLSLDLQFDTAEEGTNSNPVDVRTRTNKVRQFVLPGGTSSKQAPPRVRFRWGTFELTGVMNSLSEELSLFSRDGVPLRSKLSVQIKEQDARFAALESGPGANQDASDGPVDRAAAALAGESAADFMARNGLPPEAWRGLGAALDVSGGIELQAGMTIGFDSNLSAGAGLGVSAGVHLGLDVSVGASLGLEAGVGVDQGLALSAAGGPTLAFAQEQATLSLTAVDAARVSFGGTATASGAFSASAEAHVDARATSFGAGVPLRAGIDVEGSLG
ncbi:hypothetical protein GCM10022237_08200 [Nocardioides ginsengisoli]|uniref:Contractile injection system tube protein N-terminal domain-containing protein n=1 Tax=Nocardioides ginsengisoli TaxID=363868 RepID=A0ABW3VZB7_9ACTN